MTLSLAFGMLHVLANPVSVAVLRFANDQHFPFCAQWGIESESDDANKAEEIGTDLHCRGI
jgi:hypothetical protein